MSSDWGIVKIERYFDGRLSDLKTYAPHGNPWIFLCAASFVEYLAQLWFNKETTAQDYRTFLKDHFFVVCPRYALFRFANIYTKKGEGDLDVQMYNVLRCGIVHSFSLIAGRQAILSGGRDQSILLAHRPERHLSSRVVKRKGIDAAVFVAEEFVDDIVLATKTMFALARKRDSKGAALRANIVSWFNKRPPIGLLIL